LKIRAIAQAVSGRFVTVDVLARAQSSACEICSGQSGTGRGFIRVFRCFHASTNIPPLLPFHACKLSPGGWTMGSVAATDTDSPLRNSKKIGIPKICSFC
jgi:hypothetical protein